LLPVALYSFLLRLKLITKRNDTLTPGTKLTPMRVYCSKKKRKIDVQYENEGVT